MSERHSTVEYLAGPEELTRKELVWGIVREPPAPYCSHQTVVGATFMLLALHARQHALGRVLVSPVDVVLDEARALVLQPDVVFVAAARADIVRDQIWGAPDLVVEILSPGTRRRDTIDKRRWYAHYGVREYWVVDPASQSVSVETLQPSTNARLDRVQRHRVNGDDIVRSNLLTGFAEPASSFFRQ